MSTTATHDNESTDIDQRTRAALTESMVAYELAPGQYEVIGENHGDRDQDKYTVDTRLGACTCNDYEYREPEGGCKHLRRVQFATGEVPVPAGVEGVDPALGEATDGEVRRVATDGGIIEAGDDGEIVGESDDGGRPEDCECGEFHDDAGLPCWPCYRDGFDEPANADN